MAKQSRSGLSSAVSDLMRAAAGGDTSKVADEDLDKYVADMLLKEAKAKNKKYNDVGIRAYLPNSGSTPNTLPKMNKRFLLNVVKATDSHNQALIRATEEQAETNRRHMEQERDQNSRRRRSRSSSYHSKRRRTSRSRSPSRDVKRCIRERLTSPSRSPQTSRHRDSDEHRSYGSTSEQSPSDSEKPIVFKGRGNITAGGPSAMDKYFHDAYDPTKDTDEVVDSDGWVRNADQSEKKHKKKNKSKKSTKRDEENDSRRHKRKRNKKDKGERTVTILPKVQALDDGIVYSKGVREWDMEKKLM